MSETRLATFEAKKDRLYQTQDGLWKLTLTVKQEDMPDWLLRAPPGQRIGAAALHEIGDNEEQIKPQTDGERIRTRAVMLCRDQAFQRWVERMSSDIGIVLEAGASEWLRGRCGISSRSELATDAEAQKKFLMLETQYLQDTGRMARPR